MPTTVVSGGTGSSTTEFEPTRALSPTVIGPSTLAPAPMMTLLPTVGCRLPLGARHAQRNLVVQVAIVADLGGFADHHAHAMIDHQPATKLGGRDGSRCR